MMAAAAYKAGWPVSTLRQDGMAGKRAMQQLQWQDGMGGTNGSGEVEREGSVRGS